MKIPFVNSKDGQAYNRRNDDCKHIFLPASLKVFKKGEPVSTVVTFGICVTFWSAKASFVGVSHFTQPAIYESTKATAKYGNVALPFIINNLSQSFEMDLFDVHIIGGAKLDDKDARGEANIKITKKILDKYKIAYTSEDCGGLYGRKIIFDTKSGDIFIKKTKVLRESDWV